MKLIDSTLSHSVLDPREPDGSQHPALILLHGLGADEEDLLGLSSFLDKRFMIISVRAPYPSPYSGGFTWYDIGKVGAPEPTMFRVSCEKLSTFIADAIAGYPVDAKRVFLLGFSMGTTMSYAMALSQPGLFRAVVANSGYIAEGTHLTYEWNRLSQIEFLITHGTGDLVIPVQFAWRAKELLEAADARFEYREYPMGHEISEDSLKDLSAWLTTRLDAVR